MKYREGTDFKKDTQYQEIQTHTHTILRNTHTHRQTDIVLLDPLRGNMVGQTTHVLEHQKDVGLSLLLPLTDHEQLV